MKRIVSILILVVIVVSVIIVLLNNRAARQEASLLAEKEVDRIPVSVYTVKSYLPIESTRLSGQLIPARDLMLLSQTQGEVVRIYHSKGDWVNVNDMIAAVDDQLYKEQYEVAKSAYEKLEKDLARYKRMEASQAITAQQRREVELGLHAAKAKLKAAKNQLDQSKITTPIAGYINQLMVKQGSLVGNGAPIAEIVNTKELILSLKVAENEVVELEAVKNIDVVVPSMPGDTLRGELKFVSVKADHNNQYTAEIALENNDGAYKGGMIAVALLRSTPDQKGIYIPFTTILNYGGEDQYVFIVSQGGVEKRNVQTGNRYGDYIAIEEGVTLGDRIIEEGKNNVRPDKSIVIVEQ